MLTTRPAGVNPYDHETLATAADTPSTAAGALTLFLKQPTALLLGSLALGCLIYRLSLGQWSAYDAVIILGLLLFWPIQEWLIHVLVLHFKPRRLGRLTLDPRNATKHRAHHKDPWRTSLIFIPLFSLLPGVPALFLLWFNVLPTQALALTASTAYFALAFHYELVHYLAHIRWRPPLAHYQRLVDAHRRHHFLSEKHYFGVSMTAGDWLLRTAPPASEVQRSTTVRDLGY